MPDHRDTSPEADLAAAIGAKFDPEPMPEEEYVAYNGLRCPSCGAQATTAGGHCGDGDVPGFVFEDNRCSACGATWTAQYRLVGYTELENP